MSEPTWTQPPQLSGVPASIARADYLALIATLGLDVKDLVELRFGWRAITAVVKARNAEGKHYEDPFERNALAKHHISIPVVDGPKVSDL